MRLCLIDILWTSSGVVVSPPLDGAAGVRVPLARAPRFSALCSKGYCTSPAGEETDRLFSWALRTPHDRGMQIVTQIFDPHQWGPLKRYLWHKQWSTFDL